MTTNPSDSVDQWLATSCLSTAPRAEPEEDIDVLEVTAPQDDQRLSAIDFNQETRRDCRESAALAPEESQEVVTELEQDPQKLWSQFQAEEEPEELVDPCEDAFPPPPPPLSDLKPNKDCETEAFSSMEGEVGEWSSDAEAEDINCLDIQSSQEWVKTPQLTEPLIPGANPMSEENVTQLRFRADGTSISQTEENKTQPDSNKSDDVNTSSSPPFADESEEEEEVIDIMSCQNQLSTTDISRDACQHVCSGKQESDGAQQISPSCKQQEELLPRSHSGLAPRGENQETAQQVLGQGSPPLSAVAMEPSNQGGAASRHSQCEGVVRERHSRAGERTGEQNEQTGGEEGQKGCELGGKEPAGQKHSKGLLRDSQSVQIQETFACGEGLKHSRHTRMEIDSWDESRSDSGVSADFSPGSTTEASPAGSSTETPVEREIRRSVERENSLRRSRGLPNTTNNSQYVEIPARKGVPGQSSTGKTDKHQDKDRELAGKMMRQEIDQETQRELDLVKIGKIPGVYDKGTVRQMKERKQIFEAFQAPIDSMSPTRSKTPSWSSASNVSHQENQEKTAAQASATKGTYTVQDAVSPAQSLSSAKGSSPSRGPGFSEGKGLQVVIIENNMDVPAEKWYSAKPVAVTVVDSGRPSYSSPEEEEDGDEEELTPQENPFFKLRSSTNLVKVQQDIQETNEREKELRKQRRSLYGDRGGGGGGGRSYSMDGKSLTFSPSLNGLARPDSPDSLSTAQHSVGKQCVKTPTQPEDSRINQPEVAPPAWSSRQKSSLVQRWEAGLLNGHEEED